MKRKPKARYMRLETRHGSDVVHVGHRAWGIDWWRVGTLAALVAILAALLAA
jgi:hypothetical protein